VEDVKPRFTDANVCVKKNLWILEGTQRDKYIYVEHKLETDSNTEL
jgi:hypothetical protein